MLFCVFRSVYAILYRVRYACRIIWIFFRRSRWSLKGPDPASHYEQSLLLAICYNAQVNSLWHNLGYRDSATHVNYPDACANLARLLAKEVQLNSSVDICDLGFGFGDQDILWLEENNVKQITGFNICRLHTNIARERVMNLQYDDKIRLEVGSATNIPMSDNCVDRVTSLESAFCYDTREDFFREAFRVLRPGGKLGLTDIILKSDQTGAAAQRLADSRDAMVHTLWRFGEQYLGIGDSPKCNQYDINVYIKKLLDVGFVNIQKTDISEHILVWPNDKYKSFPPKLPQFGHLQSVFKLPAVLDGHLRAECAFEQGFHPSLHHMSYWLIVADKPEAK